MNRKVVFWLPAPILSIGLVSIAFSGRVGPGLFLLCLVWAIGFLFLSPLIQYFLLRMPDIEGRQGVACATALGATLVLSVILAMTGLFNFA